ncbi:hypothetical protein DOTSEDRAFT_46186 [Dothistroma septosporum NZE10]|uniref:Uncharacterized protein n=1 Tax=Dothistroma septosporum (strain NZE10 / CBS 128990) TaxID=675120 RepID=N1PJJ5_DOTSN|nr:hypothetical protein DOTSEDRAFT_46186 [Dothistroma septosporum NZE10]
MVELVQMCRVILYEEVSIGKFARYKALGALGCTMPKIVKDTAAWAALSSDQILLRAATACAISWSDLCATRSEDQERAQKERKIVRLIAGFVWPQDEPDPSDEQLKDLVKYNRDLLGELRGS